MSVVVHPEIGTLEIPAGVTDLASFRRWVHTDESIPEKLPVHFLNGQVWVDFSMEEFFSHNRMKMALATAFTKIEDEIEGTYSSDGMRYTSESVGFSTEPDALFFLKETFDRGEVEFRSGAKGIATELVGRPDLVIEIVSRTTITKDIDWLMESYFDAGIPEYWLIDAREGEIAFDIYKPGAKGYLATNKSGGWVKSNVLEKSFKLTRTVNRANVETFRLGDELSR